MPGYSPWSWAVLGGNSEWVRRGPYILCIIYDIFYVLVCRRWVNKAERVVAAAATFKEAVVY